MSNETSSSSWILGEARRVSDEAKKNGITIRLMGATAIATHCPTYARLFIDKDRHLSDLDFMGYSKEFEKVEQTIRNLGYVQRKLGFAVSASARGRRSIFDSKRALTIDVFYDKLEMCHTIEFTSRLSLDDPTITLADLLLEKLQIVKINQKDIKDVIVLLREHQIGDTEIETINANYISDLLSREWGFYYTATTNLDKIKRSLSDYAVLADIDRKDISAKIDRLRDVIESKPKSMRWKMRARIGPSSKWYNEVEEVVR
jgi:hypothetical protein